MLPMRFASVPPEILEPVRRQRRVDRGAGDRPMRVGFHVSLPTVLMKGRFSLATLIHAARNTSESPMNWAASSIVQGPVPVPVSHAFRYPPSASRGRDYRAC
jgi:hypothetical protein